MPDDPRKLAVTVLNQLAKRPGTLTAVMEQAAAAARFGSTRDRALFNTLVYGTLRWRGRLDHILSHFADRPIKKIDPRVLNILRIGLFQVTGLDRIPPSAAVNTAVNLARSLSVPWSAAFVNALLRRAVKEHAQVPFPAEDRTPAALSVTASFPPWLVERWVARYGYEATARLCDAVNQPPPLTLRANSLKTTAAGLLAMLSAENQRAEPTAFAPDGIRLFSANAAIFNHSAFRNGQFAIQDEAAQLVGLLLDPRRGERILDACAGLGGKSGHLAQLMHNDGSITAVDRDEARLTKLAGEMQRLGISIVRPLALSLEAAAASGRLEAPFDRVLLDAPCSGLGTIRRNPDIKWAPTKKSPARYRQVQSGLLDQAAALVRPSGILVYAVCSCEPEETESVVTDFLKNHPEFAISADAAVPPSLKQLISPGGYLRTYPHQIEMDGFFAVRCKRVR